MAGQNHAEAALLSLKIVDAAWGLGHMLLAAAHRLGKELARLRTGKELARLRTGEDEPAPQRGPRVPRGLRRP